MTIITKESLSKIIYAYNPNAVLAPQEQIAKIEEVIQLLKTAKGHVFSLKTSRLLQKQIDDLTAIKQSSLTNESFYKQFSIVEKTVMQILLNVDKKAIREALNDPDELTELLRKYPFPYPKIIWDELIVYAQEQRKLCSIPILQHYSDFYNGQ